MASSITHWLGLLKAGDRTAAQPLWERYFARLVELARMRLRGGQRRAADEEDVAISAFASFCRNAMAGRFPQLDDSTDLWKLLVIITARKAADLLVRERCQKRGGGRGRSAVAEIAGPDEQDFLEEVLGSEPTPQLAAQMAEEYEHLLDRLGDETLRAVATWKVEGYTNQEIKSKLGCSLATVERKLARIRGIWQRSAPD
jgi:DNA-directed RNA polymerase specialized sigma24 family protein